MLETIKFKKKNYSTVALRPIWVNILLDKDWLFICPHIRSTPKLDKEDFVYISVICEAISVRSSMGLISAWVPQSLVTSNTLWACVILFLGGGGVGGGGRSLYKDILFLCPKWGSGAYITRNLLMRTHFVNTSWKNRTYTLIAHFQYNAKKLTSSKPAVLVWGILREK